MNLEELEEHYLEQKFKGKDYSEIHFELKYKGISDEETKALIRAIDDRFLAGKRRPVKEDKQDYRIIGGFGLVILGTVVTVGTYTGFIPLGNVYLFAYGPILGGLAMISASKRSRTSIFRPRKKKRK